MARTLQSLIGAAPRTGIDFMAFARGQEAARELNWRDEMRQLDRSKLYDALHERDVNRAAQAYAAPILGNMQVALEAGVSPTDFLVQQMQQIRQDPYFQNMDPEAQAKVLGVMNQSATIQLQGLHNAGFTSEANKLAQAFGIVPTTNPLQQALQTGDIDQVLQAANQLYGSVFERAPDGTITVAGVPISEAQFMQYVTSSGGQPQAAYTAAAAQEQVQQAQAREDVLYQRNLAAQQGDAASQTALVQAILGAQGGQGDGSVQGMFDSGPGYNPSAGLPPATTPTPVTPPGTTVPGTVGSITPSRWQPSTPTPAPTVTLDGVGVMGGQQTIPAPVARGWDHETQQLLRRWLADQNK